MNERWNDFTGELEVQCEWCSTFYSKYDGGGIAFPYPGLCPRRYLVKHWPDELDNLMGLS